MDATKKFEVQNKQSQVRPANIPTQLTALEQWVAWQYSERDGAGKRGKVPIDPISGSDTEAF